MVAREAAMCVKLDGRSLPDIAAAAGAQLHEDRVLLDDVETSLRTRLIGAYPGDLIGPVDVGRQYDVVLVVRRIAPTLQHHEVRRRAAELVISKALAAEVNRRVNWHEHF
jgi:6-phosphofructokinase